LAPQLSLVGAHAPVAGGLGRALGYANAVGAEVVQVFVTNPRSWTPAPGSPAQDEVFRSGCAERGLPVYVHAPYLINLGSPTPLTRERSVSALAHSLCRGHQIGAAGVVVHAGSAVAGARRDEAMGQVRELLMPVLDAIPADGPRLLVEPTAGGGQPLAARVEQLAAYFDVLDHHDKLGVCLDTCHAWAAGHDLAASGGLAATMRALAAAVGQGRLGLVHANDSRDDVGSLRDRHETLGAGMLGAAAFAQLFTVPALRGVPIVVETPSETHAADIALLKRLRRRGRSTATSTAPSIATPAAAPPVTSTAASIAAFTMASTAPSTVASRSAPTCYHA